jgi:hypothetical protein
MREGPQRIPTAPKIRVHYQNKSLRRESFRAGGFCFTPFWSSPVSPYFEFPGKSNRSNKSPIAGVFVGT